MSRRERIGALLLILAAIAVAKLGQQVFRWFAYAEEREQLQALGLQVERAGLEVVHTGLRADSLRAMIERTDRELAAAKTAVSAYHRHAVGGALPAHLYGAYQEELNAYNRSVTQRNAHFEEWQRVVTQNHDAVNRYNELADRIRALATRMGEPYYSVPSPAELALRHGLVRSDP